MLGEWLEQFITANFAGDADYVGILKDKKAFKFPPGHAAKLINFITEIKGDKKTKVKRAVPMEIETEGSSSSSVQMKATSNYKKAKLCASEVTMDELYAAIR